MNKAMEKVLAALGFEHVEEDLWVMETEDLLQVGTYIEETKYGPVVMVAPYWAEEFDDGEAEVLSTFVLKRM